MPGVWRHTAGATGSPAPPCMGCLTLHSSHDASLSLRGRIGRRLREFFTYWTLLFTKRELLMQWEKCFLINQNEMSKVVVFDWHYSIPFLASVLTLASSLLANSPCHLPVASLRSSLSSWQIRLTPPVQGGCGLSAASLLHDCHSLTQTRSFSSLLFPLSLFSEISYSPTWPKAFSWRLSTWHKSAAAFLLSVVNL